MKTRLFSYRMTHDAGSAPNPYGGICSLAICKPSIRRVAKPGDWIAATGSKAFPLDHPEMRLIYAMKVTGKLSMQEYDSMCRARLQLKIPRRPASVYEEYVGDSIYKFKSSGSIELLKSVHSEANIKRDLGGEFVLLSDTFVYFGSNAVLIPKRLAGIVKVGQAHQSDKNAPFLEPFVAWIDSIGKKGIQGEPISKHQNWKKNESTGSCSRAHLKDEGEK